MKIEIKETFESFLLDFRFIVDLCSNIEFSVNGRHFMEGDDWYSNKNWSFAASYSAKKGKEIHFYIDLPGGGREEIPVNKKFDAELRKMEEKGICKNVWYHLYEFPNDKDLFFNYVKKWLKKTRKYDFDMRINVDAENAEAFLKRMDESAVVPEPLKEFLRKRQFDDSEVDCGSGKLMTAIEWNFPEVPLRKGELRFDFESNERCHSGGAWPG